MFGKSPAAAFTFVAAFLLATPCSADESHLPTQGKSGAAIALGASSPRASGIGDKIERQTFETALSAAGQDIAGLPITLTSVLPDIASRDVEGWTSYRADGTGERIFVYSGSEMFRCASWPLSMYQCSVRLASVLVHEAWHFRHGPHEAGAYEAQIGFLMRNRASTEHVQAVRIARNRVVAAERTATDAARTRYREQSR